MSNDLHAATVTYLKGQLFRKAYFSVCDVDTLLDLLEKRDRWKQHPDYKALCALHLINWDVMSLSFANSIKAKVFEMLEN